MNDIRTWTGRLGPIGRLGPLRSRWTDVPALLGHRARQARRVTRRQIAAWWEALPLDDLDLLRLRRERRRAALRAARRTALAAGLGAGMAAGTLVMYLFDPSRGRRRRTILRGRTGRLLRLGSNALAAALRDLGNRTRGWIVETRGRLRPSDAPEAVLTARVRAALGRVVSRPGTIDVSTSGGQVVLRGVVLASELKGLLRAVATVRGVVGVENRLEVHESATAPPVAHRRERALRAAASLAGGALVGYGASRRDRAGIGIGALGAGLLAGATVGPALRARLTGHGVAVRKTIHIKAPVADVFGYWSNFENFPLFMRNVREVEDFGDGRSHWVVAGPAGTTVEWDAEIVERIDNHTIAWRSVEGSTIANEGRVRFTATDDGTRVDVTLSYRPPAGTLGHLVASLFGKDPKHEMDQDLARMKVLIETGNPPHDAADPLLKNARAARS